MASSYLPDCMDRRAWLKGSESAALGLDDGVWPNIQPEANTNNAASVRLILLSIQKKGSRKRLPVSEG